MKIYRKCSKGRDALNKDFCGKRLLLSTNLQKKNVLMEKRAPQKNCKNFYVPGSQINNIEVHTPVNVCIILHTSLVTWHRREGRLSFPPSSAWYEANCIQE